jgi:hypothetical protein
MEIDNITPLPVDTTVYEQPRKTDEVREKAPETGENAEITGNEPEDPQRGVDLFA